MSNAFVTIKMCYVYNQWYDISCATPYVAESLNTKIDIVTRKLFCCTKCIWISFLNIPRLDSNIDLKM